MIQQENLVEDIMYQLLSSNNVFQGESEESLRFGHHL